MSNIDISKIDLNLLNVFDTIMTEGTLTRAGRSLGMTQSAVSHALSRLREVVGDPLFERSRRGVEPTQRAKDIAPGIRKAVGILKGCLVPPVAFDPATVKRTFVLDLPIGFEALVLPPLQDMTSRYPGLVFRVFGGGASDISNALAKSEVQLALDHAASELPGFRSERLFKDPFALVARRRHPEVSGPVSKATYGKLQHLALTWIRGFGPSPLDAMLAREGLSRKTRIYLPHITSMPNVLANSDLVATLPWRIAKSIAKTSGLAVFPLDFEIAELSIFMVWHGTADDDQGHIWLREMLRKSISKI